MGYEPPGLERKPDDETLASFGSLMGEANSPPPGFVKTAATLPVQLVKFVVRIPVAILKFPLRLFGRKGS